ncbi:hypothetical protein LRX75_15680 [Rhizobium sp. DKSPLA3]|uniref:Uncharacterized protein n=1 Tax=Rhizobium quercicola TaxID=2901226 RepID=A0A9X1NV31_9HYPH|nr:hypothetical protein [Rhizobium quercicola]MCD7110476.1 hypothetical protein [Rhizobium quercicola]
MTTARSVRVMSFLRSPGFPPRVIGDQPIIDVVILGGGLAGIVASGMLKRSGAMHEGEPRF